MNYIYDILLNFNDIYYDFYEWNISDNIEHIRKIPLFKISIKDMITIKNNYIKLILLRLGPFLLHSYFHQ